MNKTILRLKDKVSSELYTRLNEQRVLHLHLKRKWYDMIVSREKGEEYRLITDYWCNRFLYQTEKCSTFESISHLLNSPSVYGNPESVMEHLNYMFKIFDLIVFENGYGDVPVTVTEWGGIEIKKGKQEWGAVPGENYFTILIGNLLYHESKN